MGAGDAVAHFHQDAAECFFVAKCQEYLCSLGVNISDVELKKSEFETYIKEHNPHPEGVDAMQQFLDSCYAVNVDKHVENFVKSLILKHPSECKFDLTDVESHYRNLSLKGDFVVTILYSDGETKEISFSLKNYACGNSSIQLCSGTWHSLLNNMCLEEAEGPGNYIDVRTKKKFRAQSKSLKKRNYNYVQRGYEKILPHLNVIDGFLEEVKYRYVRSEDTKMWTEEVAGMWKSDCEIYGNKAIDNFIAAMELIPNKDIKDWFLKKTDMKNAEELLVIGKDDMICSYFNEKYKSLIVRANNPESTITFEKVMKTLRMKLVDSEGEIVKVDIPCTLQKNGAWHLPKTTYEGTQYHAKEKKDLHYGERRPKKSREISTSTNMWFRIADYV